MLNTILYVVCVLVLVIVLLMVLTNDSSSDSSSSDSSSSGSSSSGSSSSGSSSSGSSSSGSSSSGSSSGDSSTKTLLTSEDMIYCLTQDNECKKMTYEKCSVDNGSSNFYMTKKNCNSALDNMSGTLDKVWCFHNGVCSEYDKDEIGFGLKIEDVSCSPQYSSEEKCKNGIS